MNFRGCEVKHVGDHFDHALIKQHGNKQVAVEDWAEMTMLIEPQHAERPSSTDTPHCVGTNACLQMPYWKPYSSVQKVN
jgi:hypothetical protein